MCKEVDSTILITGKSSYIGNNLKNYIVQQPCSVDVDMISMRDNSFERVDYRKYNSIVHVSGIVHQRKSNVSYEEYYQVNVENTYKLASLAKAAGVKQFIFLSTMAVYGDKVSRISKDNIPNPTSDYGKTKLLAENRLLELSDNSFKIAIIRPPMVYGKGCPGNYQFLSKLAQITPIFPYLINERSMIYIENLCMYLYEIISRGYDGMFFPQNKEYVSSWKLVREIARCHDHKVRGVRIINPLIRILRKRVRMVSKVFDDLTYDNNMSKIDGLQLIDFKQSVEITEKEC